MLFKCAFLHVRAHVRARAHVQLSIEICLKHSGLTYPKFIAYLASPFESYLAIRILLAQNLPIASISIGGLYLNFSPWRRPDINFLTKNSGKILDLSFRISLEIWNLITGKSSKLQLKISIFNLQKWQFWPLWRHQKPNYGVPPAEKYVLALHSTKYYHIPTISLLKHKINMKNMSKTVKNSHFGLFLALMTS